MRPHSAGVTNVIRHGKFSGKFGERREGRGRKDESKCHEIALGLRRREGREREDEFFFERSTRENAG